MLAVFGNLLILGVAVALFVATINLGRHNEQARPLPRRRVTEPAIDLPG